MWTNHSKVLWRPKILNLENLWLNHSSLLTWSQIPFLLIAWLFFSAVAFPPQLQLVSTKNKSQVADASWALICYPDVTEWFKLSSCLFLVPPGTAKVKPSLVRRSTWSGRLDLAVPPAVQGLSCCTCRFPCQDMSSVPLLLQECANKENLQGSDLQILVNSCPSHFAARLDNIFGVEIFQVLSDGVGNPLSHYPEVDAVYLAVTLNMSY